MWEVKSDTISELRASMGDHFENLVPAQPIVEAAIKALREKDSKIKELEERLQLANLQAKYGVKS